jgi:[acyl-carrier-protein] S-malonyltransferase
MNIAFIFPGQGAQYVGMGQDFAKAYPEAREVFDKADSLLGYSLSSIIFEGPEEDINKTKHSQVAIYVNSCALLSVIKKLFPELKPRVCAGLSLGEYTALYVSGRISFEEGLLLVQKRAQFMNDACEKYPGKMSAVLGLDEKSVRDAIGTIEDVWVANCNCPNQIVISGTASGVEKATISLKDNKAKRVIPLTVHGAFHSGLMSEAEKQLTPFVDQANITDSDIEFVMNVKGEFISSIPTIKELLKKQVTHSVLWEKGIREIEKQGIDLYIEIGPGKTLLGMNKKIKTSGKTISIDKSQDLNDLKNLLNESG